MSRLASRQGGFCFCYGWRSCKPLLGWGNISMFIAHIPSGYIMSLALLKIMRHIPVSSATLVVVGILGAMIPDLDLAYFYLIDNRQTHHHRYASHWPLLWIALLVISALWLCWGRRGKAAFLSLVFALGGLLHIILDTVVGDIWWFAPFVDQPYALFTVPARFEPWWLNFMLHWSFAVELALCLWALVLYRKGFRPHFGKSDLTA